MIKSINLIQFKKTIPLENLNLTKPRKLKARLLMFFLNWPQKSHRKRLKKLTE
jgi:hypothetical protein